MSLRIDGGPANMRDVASGINAYAVDAKRSHSGLRRPAGLSNQGGI
jgi:hypothetical protein